MDIFGQYKSPLGYTLGTNNIDSYGVDHSGFSTRDELAYQTARQQRENQIMQNYNRQGINENYPQAGTNFWGNSPENNYGFGASNITPNVENRSNQTVNLKNAGADLEDNAFEHIPSSIRAQLGLKLRQTIADIYNVYKEEGAYGIAKKYGTPSVQQAGQLAQDLHNIPISDVDKHNAVSCVGASGGLTSLVETIVGGAGKELVDFYNKTANPNLRKQYGGVSGILEDNWKDFKNDVQSAWKGYQAGDTQVCRDYLPSNYKRLIP